MKTPRWPLVVLLLSQALLLFVPLAVLGAAIGWPGSLRSAPADLFPRLLAHANEVRLGYGVYLLYSLLFGVTGVLLVRRLDLGGSATGQLAQVAAGASALARSLGILRWLTAMPVLAQAHADATSDTARQNIEIAYRALNAWGGGIGEALGVSLFAALWLGLVNAGAFERRTLPRPVAVAGLVTTALLLLPSLGLFGIEVGPLLTVAGVALQLWFLAVAGVVAFGRTPAASTQPARLSAQVAS
jgi:hypothetical protein